MAVRFQGFHQRQFLLRSNPAENGIFPSGPAYILVCFQRSGVHIAACMFHSGSFSDIGHGHSTVTGNDFQIYTLIGKIPQGFGRFFSDFIAEYQQGQRL